MIAFLRDYGAHRLNSRLIDERRCIPPHVVLDCAAEGLLGLQISERYGGQQLSYRDTFRVLEQTAAVDPNVLLLLCVHYAIGTPPIAAFADDSVKAEVLPQLASGRALATVAASEPGAGANLAGIRATARKTPGGDYVLDGNKCWISLGSWAKYVSVFVRHVDDDGEPGGMAGFVVQQGTPGFEPGAEALTLGMKGLPQNQIALRNLRLPASALLGREGQGDRVAQHAFMMGRAVVAISAVGVMKRCLQLTARYAQRRTVATGRLFDNGLTAALLYDSVMSTAAVEAIAYDIAASLDRGHQPPTAVYLTAKILGAELMWQVIDRSVQMLGARGFMDTNVVGQYFRDMRLLRIFEGPTESMTLYLGSLACKDERRFVEMLETELADTPLRLREVLARAAEVYAPHVGEQGLSRQARESWAAKAGELAAWAILEAVVTRASRRNPQAAAVAAWCAEQLDARVRTLQATAPSLPETHSIADQIDRWSEDIGFIEQTLAGEARELDPWLLHDAGEVV